MEDEGRMRGGRWIYHRQVAVPLELWIMHSSSIRRKWEIEFTLTGWCSRVHLGPSVHVPFCKPAIRRDQHQRSMKKKKKTDGRFKDMFLRYIFPPSNLHQKCKDKPTHVRTQTLTREIHSDWGFFPPYITAVWHRMLEDAVLLYMQLFPIKAIHLFFSLCPHSCSLFMQWSKLAVKVECVFNILFAKQK